ncbi:hypothetical protein BH09VER1_BH09VER1_47790 [soil metagenome]
MALGVGANVSGAADEALSYRVSVESPVNAPNEPSYWFQARAGVVAPDDKLDRVVMTAQLIDSVGTHMYHGVASMWSVDLGKTWQGPTPQPTMVPLKIDEDLSENPIDMTPMWHKKTGKLLVTGGSLIVSKKLKKHTPGGGGATVYSVYDAEKNTWNEWRKLKLPDDPEFAYARAGCTQGVELDDGEIMLPIYFGSGGNDGNHKVTVLRCRFDGETLSYVEHGDELTLAVKRGLGEPSLAKYGDSFYLTLRNDNGAYLATSKDGLHFEPMQEWKFDDGQPLGSCNTQQHWVTHSDGLFLVYTRNHAGNDEVFRNRAPLFMAQFDPKTGTLLRATETVLLPKVGGSEFGNFGVCNVDTAETWVTAGRGNANPNEPSIYISRINWSKPNLLAPNSLSAP